MEEVFDLVGIGALNADFVIDEEELRKRVSPTDANAVEKEFDSALESPASERTVQEVLEKSGNSVAGPFAGGSTFNLVHALASVRPTQRRASSTAGPRLRLAYIGALGEKDGHAPLFTTVMKAGQVDTSCVFIERDMPPGLCVSYLPSMRNAISDNSRRLLVAPCANAKLGEFLTGRRNRTRALRTLRRARVVHLTSLFDEYSPGVVANLLEEAKSANPNLTVSFDPGWHWCSNHKDYDRLFRLADILFLNRREFDELARPPGELSSADRAARIFESCTTGQTLIVLKEAGVVAAYRRLPFGVREIEHPYIPLSPSEIRDDTGAGDVFAAGFLGMRLIDTFSGDISESLELGVRLAAAKLRFVGSSDYGSFSGVAAQYLRELAVSVVTGSGSSKKAADTKLPVRKVFIAHGRSLLWQKLALYLKDRCRLDVEYFGRESVMGRTATALLEEWLESCSFAVAVVTAEDEMASGTSRTRQNVVHEIGLFQGRHGTGRVAILMQQGTEPFSNIDGLQHIPFSGDEIQGAFSELRDALVRESILPL